MTWRTKINFDLMLPFSGQWRTVTKSQWMASDKLQCVFMENESEQQTKVQQHVYQNWCVNTCCISVVVFSRENIFYDLFILTVSRNIHSF